MTEYQEWESWEPQNSGGWLEIDPLSRLAVRENQQEFARLANAALAAYQRLPAQLRRQAWREREILASLWSRRSVVGLALAETSWLGVGRRSIAGRRTLAAIISTETPLPPDPIEAREAYSLPPELEVPTRVPGVEGASVPVVLEQTAGPIRYGVVKPGEWALASSEQARNDVAPLQSGDEVAGEDRWGARSPGTLAAIVSRAQSVQPLMLSVAHVFGPVGTKIIAYRGGVRAVGKVIMTDIGLDAAIAEPYIPWHFDYRLKANDALPALPVQATSDMPVRMWGSVSKFQQGWVDQALVVPAGAGAISMLVPFSASIASSPGDSGALIVAGPGSTPGYLAAASSPGSPDPLTGAMLGMLLAGPNPKNPGPRPAAWAVPLTEIVEKFQIQVWARQ
jgi:hypothetical protein